MSSLKQDSGEDFPEAAEKHLLDSQLLLEKDRFDGAAYLAGYVVECSLKTIIQKENRSVPRIHDLGTLKAGALRFAAMPKSRTAKYARRRFWSPSSIYAYRMGGWEEKLRYLPAGSISDADAKAWLKEAEAIFKYIIIQMRLNGEI